MLNIPMAEQASGVDGGVTSAGSFLCLIGCIMENNVTTDTSQKSRNAIKKINTFPTWPIFCVV